MREANGFGFLLVQKFDSGQTLTFTVIRLTVKPFNLFRERLIEIFDAKSMYD